EGGAQLCRRSKTREQAEKLLKQGEEKYPETPWGAAAKDRLKNDKDDARAPHSLAAVEKLFEPVLPEPAPLEPLGQMQPLNPSTDDPSADLSWAYALASKPAERRVPAPIVRLGSPDPFAFRRAMHGKIPKEDVMPLPEKLELPHSKE